MPGDPLGILTPKTETGSNDPLGILGKQKVDLSFVQKNAGNVLTDAINVQDIGAESGIDFNKLNAMKGGSMQATKEQKDLLSYGKNIEKEQIKQRDELIENTLKRKYKELGKTVNSNSPEYKKDFDNTLKALEEGDIVLTKSKSGERTTTRGAGFLESIGLGLKHSFSAPMEAVKLEMLDGKELADYLDQKERDAPEIESSKPSGFGGAIGEAVGAFPKVGGLFSINYAVPGLGTGLAAAEAELSSTGAHIEQLYHMRLNELVNGGMPFEEARIQAATEAKKDAPLAAAPDAIMTAALGNMGADVKGLNDAAKTFKNTLIESGKNVGKMAAMGGASEVARAGIEKAQGYDITTEEALDKFGEGAYNWATMDAMFRIAPIAGKLPGAVRSAWKNYMAKVPEPIVQEFTSQMGEEGVAVKEAIDKYKKADEVIPDKYSDEQRMVIADLIQARNDLKEKSAKGDEAFKEDNDLQIQNINNAIEAAKNTQYPQNIHVDNITGETIGEQKPFEELTTREKQGIVIPKEYGEADVKEIGEGENKTYKPVATYIEKDGALEISKPIKIEDAKTYTSKEAAQKAADEALARKYYEEVLPNNQKPQKKSSVEIIDEQPMEGSNTLSEVEKKPFEDRTDKQHANFIKQKFEKEFTNKGVPREQVDAAVALMDARAKASGKGDVWYRQIENIGSGEFVDGSKRLNQVEAYHGSPHVFDKFTISKIGTGEGIQAFGHGLYFTDLKDIANNYAKVLGSGKFETQYGEETLREIMLTDRISTSAYDAILEVLAKGKDNSTKEQLLNKIAQRINKKENIFDRILNKKIDKQAYTEAYNFISKDVRNIKPASRNLYEVTINEGKAASDYKWLLWDKNVDESLAKSLGKKAGMYLSGKGFEIYNKLSAKLGSQKAASDFLLKNGFDGIKYPAESLSKGVTSENARGFNYVVFNENAVKIKNRIQFQEEKGAVETLASGKKIIHALKSPDFSTTIHEIAHVFEDEISSQEREVINKWAGTKEWNTQTSEAFARGFERYLRDGNAPTTELKTIFQKAKEWLKTIYQNLSNSPIAKKITPEVKDIFDNLFKPTLKSESFLKEQSKINEKETKVSNVKAVEGSGSGNEPIATKESGVAEAITPENTQATGSKQAAFEEHPEIVKIKEEKRGKLKQVTADNLKVTLIKSRDLVYSKDPLVKSDPIAAEKKHEEIKVKYKSLRAIIKDCL